MRPAKFDYQAVGSLAEAASLLAQSDGGGRILAGGQSLIAALNLRLARPSLLIDIGRISSLAQISIEDTCVKIGPMVRHAQIVSSEALADRIGILRLAGMHIAHATIREHGTIGGSIALADPAAEWASVLVLLDGRVKAVSVRGDRWIGLRDFFKTYYTTELQSDEIVAEIEVKLPPRGVRFAFEEFSRQRGAFAIALVAAAFYPSANGQPDRVEATIGGCGRRPVLLQFPASSVTDEEIASAFDHAKVAPTSDIHASSDDRLQIAKTLLRRCLLKLKQQTERSLCLVQSTSR